MSRKVVKANFGPKTCSHHWAEPVQPLVDSEGRPKEECWNCGALRTQPLRESNAVTEGALTFPGTHELPEFGELPDPTEQGREDA